MMKSKYILITLIILSCSKGMMSQCAKADQSIWSKAWESCQASQSPNQERGVVHWIQYDLGATYTLSSSRIWNANYIPNLEKGVREISIDVSNDGSIWTNIETLEIPKGEGLAQFAGVSGPDFNHVQARFILINIYSTWGHADCASISEFQVTLGEVNASSTNSNNDEDDDEEEDTDEGEEESEDECEAPEVVEIEIESATEVFISWDDVGAEEYVVIIGNDEEDFEEYFSDEPEIFIEDLEPHTEYALFIEVICEDDSFAESEVFYFETCGYEEEDENEFTTGGESSSFKLTIAPNPSIDDVKFQLFASAPTTVRLELSNTKGQSIYRENKLHPGGIQTFEIPTSDQPAGMYVLRAFNPNLNQVALEKVILINP